MPINKNRGFNKCSHQGRPKARLKSGSIGILILERNGLLKLPSKRRREGEKTGWRGIPNTLEARGQRRMSVGFEGGGVQDKNYLTGIEDRVLIQSSNLHIIIRIILQQSSTMINEDAANASQDSQVYGFLCQKTNVFYAFGSHETYQQFLQWLSNQEVDTEEAAPQVDGREEAPMVDEATQLADFDMATREIMGVFEDPAFGTYNYEVELQEIDF